MRSPPGVRLSWGLVYLLSLAAGLTVANIYYNQPLLAGLEKSFEAWAMRADCCFSCRWATPWNGAN
jgi:hypothetical protein